MDTPVERLRHSCLMLLLMTLVDYKVSSEYKLRYDNSLSGNTRASLQNVQAKKQKSELVFHIFDTLETLDKFLNPSFCDTDVQIERFFSESTANQEIEKRIFR